MPCSRSVSVRPERWPWQHTNSYTDAITHANAIARACEQNDGLGRWPVWQAYQRHLTLFNIPPGAVTDPSTVTLSYDERSREQQALQGLDHFFSIGLTGSMPISSFQAPVQVILGYPGPWAHISGSLGFYSPGSVKSGDRGHYADPVDI